MYLAAFTGMRISELLGLRWKDVSFKRKEIVVTQSAHHGQNGYHINSTKNSEPRTIAISKKVIDFLREHKAKQDENKQVYDLHNDMIFVRKDGKEYKRSSVSSIFSDAAKLYGFCNITFHGLRHTHATLLLMAGVPVPIVSERLGHSKYSTTLDEYAHAIPSMQTEAARVFDEIMIKGDAKLYNNQHEAADVIETILEN